MKRLVLEVLFWLRALKYIWRACNGRWFIFRDAPQDIIETFAEENDHSRLNADSTYQDMHQQALDELRLRGMQRRSREAGEFHGS
jgi:hypothetical protein